jgi:hypothetical protein
MIEATLHLSKSPGGVSETKLANWTPTFAEMVDVLSTPVVGSKDGSYFIRGPVNSQGKRSDENISSAGVVILDGDSRIIPDTGEIVEGAPPPELVHELLRDLDLQHILYTSHSHGTKGDRYRVVIVPDRPLSDPVELRACVDWVLQKLNNSGVWLNSVKENFAWSQPWYFPRIREAGAPFTSFVHDGGETLDVDTCVAWFAERPTADDDVKQAEVNASVHTPDSPIGRYNTELGTPGAMLRFLVRHGYNLKGQTKLNGEIAYRLLAPESSSDQPGVVLFKSRRGPWRVYSHHGDHDPLSHKAEDAFGLLTALEFDGDRVMALESIGVFQRMIDYKEVTGADVNTKAGRGLVEAYRKQEQKAFNAKYGMLMIEGKAVVVSREVNGNTDVVESKLSAKETIAAYYANLKLPFVNGPTPDGKYSLVWGNSVYIDWLHGYYRRSYPQPVFSPQPNLHATVEMPPPGKAYNLFVGTNLVPKRGECDLILSHIFDIWCNGDDVAYQYVICWLARMLQKPAEQGKTVIVLRSGEGTGKNIVIDIFDRHFGAHSVMLTKPEDLAGFNDHLGLSVFVFLNEALWGGNKSVEGTMKSTITDDSLLVERKYLPKFKVRNCTHIMVATNNDWAVPVGIDDRRFLILDASESRKGDFKYFTALADHIRSGGQEAFIHYLLHEVDVSGFDVRAIPEINSATKLDHKIRTADSITKWWIEVLTDQGFRVARQVDSGFGSTKTVPEFMEWPLYDELLIEKQDLYLSYLENTRSSHKEAKNSVIKKIKELMNDSVREIRPAAMKPPWSQTPRPTDLPP